MNINLMPLFWTALCGLIGLVALGATLTNRWWGGLIAWALITAWFGIRYGHAFTAGFYVFLPTFLFVLPLYAIGTERATGLMKPTAFIITLLVAVAGLAAAAIVYADAGSGPVRRAATHPRIMPTQPPPPLFHGPPAKVTEALEKVRQAQGEDRREALQQAVPLLRDYLNDPDSQSISKVKDNRLPGVTLLLPSSDQVRVVSLDPGLGAESLDQGYDWIQWWDSGKHRLQATQEGGPTRITQAGLVNSPGGRRLVIVVNLLHAPWTQSVTLMALNPSGDKWQKATGGFDGLPTRVGASRIMVEPGHVSSAAPEVTAQFSLEDGGNTLRICEGRLNPDCLDATWESTGYKLR